MKQCLTILLTSFFSIMTLSLMAQVPPNDDCGSAITLPISAPGALPYCSGTIFTNANATTVSSANFPVPGCWNAEQRDVWFTFTPPGASGSTVDLNIELFGGTMINPQIVVYRGDCSGFIVQQPLGGVPACAANVSGGTDISMTVLGLGAGVPLYFRVTDGNPLGVGGDFEICVSEFCSPVNITNGSSARCGCTIYDTGGPGGNYGDNENFTYTICPTTPATCLTLDFASYDIECGALDGLFIYDGNGTTSAADLITVIRGTGTNLTVEAPSGCMTLQFISDGSINGTGFEATWNCSAVACSVPQPIDCNNPNTITSLPFNAANLTTCGAGNNYDASDACGSSFMSGEDYVFAYTTAGNECISIQTNNTAVGTGLFVMNGCPNSDVTTCLASTESATGNPAIGSIELEDAGTYYIVISTDGCPACTDFDILIQNTGCPMKVNPNVTPQEMAETMAGDNAISNVTMTCPPGAYGTFTGGPGGGTNINNGIILSTGFANDAEGPNTKDGTTLFPGQDANTAIGSSGDSLLTALSGVTTVDACVLEFDVFAPDSILNFNYLFASEEYLEFIEYDTNNLQFAYNDVFAFTITGPGIPDPRLISFIPGTNSPITVSHVNDQNWSQYYIDNSVFPAGDGPIATAYDGFTTVLEAKTIVTPCETYRIRLAIGDGFDQFFDSGVMIEANSLFNNDVELEVSAANVDGVLNAAENCLDGQIIVTLSSTQSDTVFVPLDVQGTALNGTDYQTIPTVLVFPPGITTDTIDILPFADGLVEPTESIVIYIYDFCNDSIPSDSAIILIRDDISGRVSLPSVDTLCGGTSLVLPLTGPDDFFYYWRPSATLSDSTVSNPIATPGNDITYNVIAGNGICFDTFDIDVAVAFSTITPDAVVCDPGDPVQLQAFTNRAGSTFNWTPGTGLSDSTSATPLATPTTTTSYSVEIVTDICTITEDVTITVLGTNTADVIPDATICEGQSLAIGGTEIPGATYTWTPSSTLDDPTSSNPIATPLTSTTYEVTATIGACTATAQVMITVGGDFTLDPITDQTINQGENIQLIGVLVPNAGNQSNVGNVTWNWTPPTALTSTSVPNPTATPLETITYTLSATSFAGCTGTTSVLVTVIPPAYAFPNAFTPNGDGQNDAFQAETAGSVSITNFRIFNRWGELLYSGGTSWDGSFNGKIQPQDTYIYTATVTLPTGEVEEVKGDLLLIR